MLRVLDVVASSIRAGLLPLAAVRVREEAVDARGVLAELDRLLEEPRGPGVVGAVEAADADLQRGLARLGPALDRRLQAHVVPPAQHPARYCPRRLFPQRCRWRKMAVAGIEKL